MNHEGSVGGAVREREGGPTYVVGMLPSHAYTVGLIASGVVPHRRASSSMTRSASPPHKRYRAKRSSTEGCSLMRLLCDEGFEGADCGGAGIGALGMALACWLRAIGGGG